MQQWAVREVGNAHSSSIWMEVHCYFNFSTWKTFELLPGIFSVWHWRLKKICLINASMLIAHNGKKHSIMSANLYLRWTIVLCSCALSSAPTLALLRGNSSKQPYPFHPDMEDLVYLGKTPAHLYCANFSFQCLFLKGRSLISCRSLHQEELHFSGGKLSAWVLSRMLWNLWKLKAPTNYSVIF